MDHFWRRTLFARCSLSGTPATSPGGANNGPYATLPSWSPSPSPETTGVGHPRGAAISASSDRGSAAAERTWEIARRIRLGTRRPANWLQLFRFGLVGASGYVVNLVAFAILAEGVAIHHIPAAVGAFAVAVTNNFVWNRHWTFDAATGHAGFQAARFLAVSLAGLAVNLVVLELLVSLVGMPEVPAQAIAVAVAMPVNFLGNKLWTFDRS